jgi:predicted acylesterase/phospholipase RssA
MLTYVLGDNYSVRLVNAQRHAAAVVKTQTGKGDEARAADRPGEKPVEERLKLHDAILLWKRANACESESTKCPRPIIVAASGGASRAGFFTASVLGKLIDDGSDNRKRLFAISSVSGSSVGAVMTVAALATSADRQPCRDQDFWLRHDPKVTDWRSCLEALMSGDFLTPVFSGLVFRDSLRFLGAFGGPGSAVSWADRATLLERSWERHFRRSLKQPANPSRRNCVGDLDCPFLTLRPREVDGQVDWLPLLLLNGASVSTGQRIVTSTIDPWYRPIGECLRTVVSGNPEECPVLHQTFDFHWLINGDDAPTGWISGLRSFIRVSDYFSSTETVPSPNDAKTAPPEQPSSSNDGSTAQPKPKPKPKPRLLDTNDVRLSTAAHNSARFPFISPPGEVHNIANNVVDRIVDGGYFENFGAQTALELVYAIRAVDSDLVPFVLLISNDPEIPTDQKLRAPNAGEGAFLPDLSAPAQTILNTRAARGALAVEGVVTLLADELTPGCRPYAAHVRVWPEYLDSQDKKPASAPKPEGDAAAQADIASRTVRPLSFSWWLSKPVQMRLHQQTEFVSKDSKDGDNRQALAAVAKALAPKLPDCTSKGQSAPALKYEGVRTDQRKSQ